jgi:hypothetical protein
MTNEKWRVDKMTAEEVTLDYLSIHKMTRIEDMQPNSITALIL